jgi:isopenicillin N synthase-like dioxygenase
MVWKNNKNIIAAAAHSEYGMLTILATDGTPGLQACFFHKLKLMNFYVVQSNQCCKKNTYIIHFRTMKQ